MRKRDRAQEPKGLRYHVLKFQVPLSWEIETATGFEYDATFYYNRFFGFRSGTCFPYRPFSQTSRLPILELPTGYMDWERPCIRKQDTREQLETLEKTRKAVEGVPRGPRGQLPQHVPEQRHIPECLWHLQGAARDSKEGKIPGSPRLSSAPGGGSTVQSPGIGSTVGVRPGPLHAIERRRDSRKGEQ